jgi:orsellinic acid C2-O-methyltransferase
MSEHEPASDPQSPDLARKLLQLIGGKWMTQATYVATELRIPDLLATGPKSADELAGATQSHAPSLRRLLRALVTLDLCEERADGSFELTPMGSLLRSDGENSLRSWAIFGGKYQWATWGNLLYSVKTGESARKLLIGTDGFEFLDRDPERAAVFNQAMVELTRLISSEVARAYDFSGMSRVADIGGGHGELLAAILAAYPDLRGLLFDLPHAIETASPHLKQAGVADRCELVAGSFFEAVPPGADAYLLKSIIHDWNDERSIAILKTCRAAMAREAKLLLVERIMPERMEEALLHQSLAQSDLNMLVGPGGQERTEGEFRDLLSASGFRLTRILPVGPNSGVIEGVPA